MRWLPSLALSLWCALSSAATVTGKVTDPGGAAISGSNVRLWAKAGKWFSFTAAGGQTTTTNAMGVFTFSNVPASDYIVDVQPGGGFAERWYDTDGSGYVPADADIITLVSGQTRIGVDVGVQASGGIDGTVRLGGSLAAGLQVTVEQVADPRIHHNDTSHGAEHQGQYSIRGMPPGQYRVVVHDPSAANGDEVSIAPFTIVSNMNASTGVLSLTAAPTDPSEPNDTRATATTFTAVRGTPYNSPTNSRIAPRNSGDVDWYCANALAGERFIARAQGTLAVEANMSHESPWVDPVIAAYRDNGTGTFVKFAEDDDSGPLITDAELDTGELPAAGRICFVVSTYGDTGYTGANQGSAGDYKLTITYGNRGPTATATMGGSPLPSMVTLNEGDLLAITVAWSDPEMDALQSTWNMVGASGAVATSGNFLTSMPMGTFSWRAPQTAAKDSPYVLTFRVADAEIARLITVNVVVLEVNVAPTVPMPLSPADAGRITTQTPSLVCRESIDDDQETLTYEFQLYYGGDGGVVAQSGSAVGVDGGFVGAPGAAPLVSFSPMMIPENSLVRWRARAFDGHAPNGYSVWSSLVSFIVDVMNDPPAAPVLDKPADGDTVLARRPTLAAVPPVDPEGDAYSLYFEVATDAMFTMSVGVSPPVAVGPGATTMWTFDKDLDWGSDYFARVWAVDVRNGKSAYSNVNSFKVRMNAPPTVPAFTTPDTNICMGGFVLTKPDKLTVGPATDMEGDVIRIQVRAFPASEDPMTATPLFDVTKAQTLNATDFDFSAVSLPMDVQHRLQARAVDNFGASGWSECVFTVGEPPEMNDGGQGGGSGGSGGGGGTGTKGGCHCGSVEALAAFAMLALLKRRRRG